MLMYVGRRLITSLLLLLGASVLIFAGMHLIPGNPLAIYEARPGFSAQQIAQLRHELGLDQPIWRQYLSWLNQVAHGTFGRSDFDPTFTTSALLFPAVPATVELACAGILLALAMAIPAALICALRPLSIVDRFFNLLATASFAIPSFWLGVMLLALFSVKFNILPARGYVGLSQDPLENIRLLILPAVTLALGLFGIFLRFLRASILDVIALPFMQMAHAKGLTWRQVVVRHGLLNAFMPTLHVAGAIFGSLLGGIVVIEYVFGWPGVGGLMLTAINNRDYSVIEGILILAAAAFIAVSLAVDIISLAIDPRLRASVRRASGSQARSVIRLRRRTDLDSTQTLSV